MEKFTRQLSRGTAFIIGILAIIGIYLIYNYGFGHSTSYLYLILLCAVMGGLVGLAMVMLYKGITGMTPQERRGAKKQ